MKSTVKLIVIVVAAALLGGAVEYKIWTECLRDHTALYCIRVLS